MNKFPTLSSILINDNSEYKRFMSRNVRQELITAVIESGQYEYEINYLLETILLNKLENNLFEGNLTDTELYSYILEASVADWFKTKADKAKELIKSGSEKAKDAGTKLIAKIGDSFNSVVKIISESVASFLAKAWEFIKAEATAAYSKYADDVKHHVARWKHNEKHDASQEIANMKNMAKFGANYIVKKFPTEVKAAANKVSNTEVSESLTKSIEQSIYAAIIECIKEDSTQFFKELNEFEIFVNRFDMLTETERTNLIEPILESGHDVHIHSDMPALPGLSMISRKVSQFPPFKWLHNIEHAIGNKFNNIFEKVSLWLSKVASGPGPFKFVYIGTVVGLVAGSKIKGGVKEVVHHIGEKAIGVVIAAAMPGIGWLLTVLKTIATGMWFVEVISFGLELGGSAAIKAIHKPEAKTTEHKPTHTTDNKPHINKSESPEHTPE